MLTSYRSIQTDVACGWRPWQYSVHTSFPSLSLSLQKGVSFPALTSLLTFPEDFEILRLESRVDKPDVQFLRCGSCSVTEVNRYFEIPEGLSRLNIHGYYIQVTFCTSDKKSDDNYSEKYWSNLFNIYLFIWGTPWRSWLRHCATSRKVAGSIPDGVIGVFNLNNPSCRTMALGLTYPLTEMCTRNISWG